MGSEEWGVQARKRGIFHTPAGHIVQGWVTCAEATTWVGVLPVLAGFILTSHGQTMTGQYFKTDV